MSESQRAATSATESMYGNARRATRRAPEIMGVQEPYAPRHARGCCIHESAELAGEERCACQHAKHVYPRSVVRNARRRYARGSTIREAIRRLNRVAKKGACDRLKEQYAHAVASARHTAARSDRYVRVALCVVAAENGNAGHKIRYKNRPHQRQRMVVRRCRRVKTANGHAPSRATPTGARRTSRARAL